MVKEPLTGSQTVPLLRGEIHGHILQGDRHLEEQDRCSRECDSETDTQSQSSENETYRKKKTLKGEGYKDRHKASSYHLSKGQRREMEGNTLQKQEQSKTKKPQMKVAPQKISGSTCEGH